MQTHYIKKISGSMAVSLLILLAACSGHSIKQAREAKSGFSHITDVPIPESAQMNLDKSIIAGEGGNWAGHLVYSTNQDRGCVIDFINEQMQRNAWKKQNELLGLESILMFMKDKRMATVRVTEGGLFPKKTIVVIDMAITD